MVMILIRIKHILHAFILCSPIILGAHHITITSDHATAHKHNDAYHFAHIGNVKITGDDLNATCSRVYVVRGNHGASHIVGQNVTLTRKDSTLSAHEVIITPHTDMCRAHGAVRITATHSGSTLTTHADHVSLNLKTHTLHSWTSKTPVTSEIDSTKHEPSHSPPPS